MTYATALSGTRMGRKVKTVEEFMAEMNGMNKAGLEGEIDLATKQKQNAGSFQPSERSITLQDGVFTFSNVPYRGGVLAAVERPAGYLNHGNALSLKNHLTFLFVSDLNPEGWTIAGLELEYQLARIAFQQREDNAGARKYIAFLRNAYARRIVTSDVPTVFANSEVHVKNLVDQHEIMGVLPENFYIISNFRSTKKLNEQYTPFEPELCNFLQLLLGEGSMDAGKVFSYIAPRYTGRLRATGLRSTYAGLTERVFTIGGDDTKFILLDTLTAESESAALGVRFPEVSV